jgi:hypothetical protein
MNTSRDPSGAHRYGTHHKRLRERFVRRIRAGEQFFCWRPGCGKPIDPDPTKWDLGHVDAEHRATFGSRWPECRKCNRSTLPRMLAKARAEAAEAAPRRSREW